MTGETCDSITELLVKTGPDGTLTNQVCAALADDLATALGDTQVRAIILVFEVGQFEPTAGAGTSDRSIPLGDLCLLFEKSEKPVIAVLTGDTCGDALELTLAAHYRVASGNARILFSGARIDVPPSGGATQRLPRLLGAQSALVLLLGSEMKTPAGLIDVADAPDALLAARALANEELPPRPTSNRNDALSNPNEYMKEVGRVRAAFAKSPLVAPLRIIGCVEAALLLPFEAGLAMEKAAFEDCANSPTARALRGFLNSEQTVMPTDKSPVQAIERIAIVGGTTMAGDLALACLDAGLDVTLIALDAAGQAIALERVLDLYDAAVEGGALSADERDARLLRITPDGTLDDLPSVDAIWESGDEMGAVKDDLWRAMGLLARPGALLLAAGDTQSLDHLARTSERVADCATLHLGGDRSMVTQLATLPETAPETIIGAAALARRLGQMVVTLPDLPGLVAHPLTLALENAIERLLLGGKRAEAIDRALIAYGFSRAPCAELDRVGLDFVLSHRRAVARALGATDTNAETLSVLDILVDSELTGMSAGTGLLRWDGATPQGESEEVRALVDALAEADGITPLGDMSDAEIAETCVAAMANAGARLIQAGQGVTPAHVDVVAVHGLGFPRLKGGPMIAADMRGLIQVEQMLSVIDVHPSVLFNDRIKAGQGFHAPQ